MILGDGGELRGVYSYIIPASKAVRITFNSNYCAIIMGRGGEAIATRIIMIGTGYSKTAAPERNQWFEFCKSAMVEWTNNVNVARSIEIQNKYTVNSIQINVLCLTNSVPTFVEINNLSGAAVTDRIARLSDIPST